MEISKKNWKDRIAPFALGVGLIFTVCWAAAALASIGHIIGWWVLPVYLAELVPGKTNLSGVSAGETGDFLTGWLTPLALTWFVITVFMQQHELKLQRIELEQLREEFAGSRKAADEQAKHQSVANQINNRTLVRLIIDDSKEFTARECIHLVNALNSLWTKIDVQHKIITSDTSIKNVHSLVMSLLVDGKLSRGLSLEAIMSDSHRRHDYESSAADIIRRLSDQFLALKREAKNADIEDYFGTFCTSQIEGELMKICRQLVDRNVTN